LEIFLGILKNWGLHWNTFFLELVELPILKNYRKKKSFSS